MTSAPQETDNELEKRTPTRNALKLPIAVQSSYPASHMTDMMNQNTATMVLSLIFLFHTTILTVYVVQTRLAPADVAVPAVHARDS